MRDRHSVICILAIALVVTLAPERAEAQFPRERPPGPKRVDLSGSGGLLLSTDWSDLVLLGSTSPVGGTVEQILVRDLVVDPGPVYDASLTYWEGRYGFRAHGGFGRSCLAVGRSCGDLAALAEGTGSVKIKSYRYDIGAAIGLLHYKPDRWAWPYVFVGLGGVTYDLDRTVGPPLTFIERSVAPNGQTVVVRDNPAPLLIAVDELGVETRLALNFGVGTDFKIPLGPTSLGLRLELSDHVHDSPVNLQVTNLDSFRDASQLRFGAVHNLRASAGVVLQLGR